MFQHWANTGSISASASMDQLWASGQPSNDPLSEFQCWTNITYPMSTCQGWAIIVICMLNQCMHYLQWAKVGITIAMESIIADIGPMYPCYLG